MSNSFFLEFTQHRVYSTVDKSINLTQSDTFWSDVAMLTPKRKRLNNTAKRKLERLHHHLSKFEVPVAVNLKHIFELFGLYTTCFLI